MSKLIISPQYKIKRSKILLILIVSEHFVHSDAL